MEPSMAEKLDPRQVVTFEELLRARKGLLTNDEV